MQMDYFTGVQPPRVGGKLILVEYGPEGIQGTEVVVDTANSHGIWVAKDGIIVGLFDSVTGVRSHSEDAEYVDRLIRMKDWSEVRQRYVLRQKLQGMGVTLSRSAAEAIPWETLWKIADLVEPHTAQD